MIILCTVDITTREVTIPSDQRIASYDHKVDVIRFQVETIPGFSLDTSSIKIAAKGPNKARHDYAVDPATVAIEEETGYITFDWPIPQGVTEMPEDMFGYGATGQLIFAVCAEIISGSTVSKAWHSDDGIITVVAHLEPEAGGGEDPSEEATNAQKIGQLQTDVAVINTQVGALANGSPAPVETIAEMTDESAVYLYTGSETGYTAGNWYYYNGSAWTSGGAYGGAVTSTTFTEHGVPADDFAVGQALAGKADADDVDAIDDRVTALEAGGSGSGLTDAQKRAILNCFAHVAWTDNQGQTYYDELEDVLFNDTELSRITASYSNENPVYPDTALDDLRPYITVRAYYTDGTNTPVNAYAIRGGLEIGQNILTITYEGKTATITVTAVEKPVSDMTHWSDGIKYTDIEVVEDKYFDDGAIKSYGGWDRTGYIPCHGASTLVFEAADIANGLNRRYNGFFDENKSYIQSMGDVSTSGATITVPSNAHYFGFSGEDTKVAAFLGAGVTPHA